MCTIFHFSTRGGLYSIALLLHEDGTFCIKEYKHGEEQGAAWLGGMSGQDATREYNRRIENAAKYDGIMYIKNLKPILEVL